jgi:hypothetical protein
VVVIVVVFAVRSHFGSSHLAEVSCRA